MVSLKISSSISSAILKPLILPEWEPERERERQEACSQCDVYLTFSTRPWISGLWLLAAHICSYQGLSECRPKGTTYWMLHSCILAQTRASNDKISHQVWESGHIHGFCLLFLQTIHLIWFECACVLLLSQWILSKSKARMISFHPINNAHPEIIFTPPLQRKPSSST